MLNNPLVMGAILALGLAAGWGAGAVCRAIRLPAVIGYILVGIVLGRSVLGLLTVQNMKGLSFIIYAALALIGFDIGGELAVRRIREWLRPILWTTLAQALFTAFLVTTGVYLYTGNLYEALIFGSIATTTAPITTAIVIREQNACGPLCSTVFAVVGFGDAMAVVLYALAVLYAEILLSATGAGAWATFGRPAWQVFGALLLGGAAGLFLLAFSRDITRKKRLLATTLAIIAAASVAAYYMHFSVILTNLALGVAVINLTAFRREDLFELARSISTPVYIAFFVLAGASMDLHLLATMGWLGAIYLVCRTVGKITGAGAGSALSHAPSPVRRYLGVCLLSQGVVAIGLATQTAAELGGRAGLQLGTMLVTIVSAAAIVFQLVGAPAARYAIIRSGEALPADGRW